MPNFELICGDCITEIERLAESGRKFDAIFTDPPLLFRRNNSRGNNLRARYSKIR